MRSIPRGRGNRDRRCQGVYGGRSIPAWAGEPPQACQAHHKLRVYPRVGGGTKGWPDFSKDAQGLSPRGRGNLAPRPFALTLRRSIPAWAGEPEVLVGVAKLNWVYPRVGGGTMLSVAWSAIKAGLSPRGRGNRPDGQVKPQVRRSIPAWAGEPICITPTRGRYRVYPRVGGGTVSPPVTCATLHGLSPRGRGNRVGVVVVGELDRSIPAWAGDRRRKMARRSHSRSIPAWAGEPPFQSMMYCWAKVYPRVGGGTARRRSAYAACAGLSPRGRGNQLNPVCQRLVFGSIPRGRGNRVDLDRARADAGSIPAWAGGTSLAYSAGVLTTGLSPRGRGNHSRSHRDVVIPRSIPAWAGEPRANRAGVKEGWVYPRVGGGTGLRGTRNGFFGGLSPRGRGNPTRRTFRQLARRSIPAWAGEPYRGSCCRRRGRVYPRVGGGTRVEGGAWEDEYGLSPRGRGNPDSPPGSRRRLRSIPAWAGEPG